MCAFQHKTAFDFGLGSSLWARMKATQSRKDFAQHFAPDFAQHFAQHFVPDVVQKIAQYFVLHFSCPKQMNKLCNMALHQKNKND